VVDRIKSVPEAKKKLIAIFTSAGDPLPWAVDPGKRKVEQSIPIKTEILDIVWVHVIPSV
jgi:hypothetical protein